jgi:hypothetical protein
VAVRFLIADRFNRFPWEIDDVPADLVAETVRLMNYLPREPAVVIKR